MDRKRMSFLFHHYLNNSCTDEERKELFELIEQSENDAHLKSLLDQLWKATPSSSEYVPYTIAEKILDQNLRPAPVPKKKKARQIFAMASLFVGLLFGAVSSYLFMADRTSSVASLPAEEVSSRSFIRLPDGSTVVLNAGSALDYPDSFDGHPTREVSLIGEAYFDISHDAEKPFIVRTGKISTKVLGTAFNVRAFPKDENIIVTVTRGKVEVSNEAKILGVIMPDQQITFNKKFAEASQESVNSVEALVWIEKDLFFDDVTMESAAERLEERFNISIDFEDEEIKKCRFTATFIHGEEIDQIIQVICEFNHAKFKYTGESAITISGAGCGQTTNPK